MDKPIGDFEGNTGTPESNKTIAEVVRYLRKHEYVTGSLLGRRLQNNPVDAFSIFSPEFTPLSEKRSNNKKRYWVGNLYIHDIYEDTEHDKVWRLDGYGRKHFTPLKEILLIIAKKRRVTLDSKLLEQKPRIQVIINDKITRNTYTRNLDS